jgi:hypothetical protein
VDSIKGFTSKDADEVLFDAKFQAKEVASITSKKLDETFSDKEQFEETLKRTFRKTTSFANEAVIAAAPVFEELSPVLSKSAKRAARQLRKIDVSQSSTASNASTKFELPKVEMPEMPKMEMPKVDIPAKEKDEQRETKKVEDKKEEAPKPSESPVIEEKDTKAIEAAKKEAAEKVLKEMAALEKQMSRDVESARDKVAEAEIEADRASTSASSSDGDVEIVNTTDGLRFSVDEDDVVAPAAKSGAANKAVSKKLSVPDVELPAGTKVIRDSEDDGDTK